MNDFSCYINGIFFLSTRIRIPLLLTMEKFHLSAFQLSFDRVQFFSGVLGPKQTLNFIMISVLFWYLSPPSLSTNSLKFSVSVVNFLVFIRALSYKESSQKKRENLCYSLSLILYCIIKTTFRKKTIKYFAAVESKGNCSRGIVSTHVLVSS